MSVELAAIVRDMLPVMIMPAHSRKVLTHIRNCRTAVLGRHKDTKCNNPECNHIEISYNSCRDRNCPKCLGAKKLKWISECMKAILPINYFHVVFTIPSILRKVFKYNKKICYSFLFKAVSSTLNEVSAKNKKLKAKLGFILILHTWTQLLHFHPHIHCIVSGGGISLDKTKWKSCNQNYLLPKKVLEIVFRAKLLKLIKEADEKGLLKYPETDNPPDKLYLNNLQATLKRAVRCTWVIYLKKAFGGPTGVINYLGNYTHRIALSETRIKQYTNGMVTFSWKDRKDGNKVKYETIKAYDFIQRFIFHILPSRFVKIRYYGFMAGKSRKTNIKLCKKLIIESGIKLERINQAAINSLKNKLKELEEPKVCPCCKKGLLLDMDSYIENRVKTG